MFWFVVGAVVVVGLALLVLAWRADRRGTGRDKHIRPPSNDPAVGEAKAMRRIRDIGGMGPGRGP
jgi:hypothetical protein